jgi:hypothetical protein
MASKTVKIIVGVAAIIVVGVATAFYVNYRMKVNEMNEKLSTTIGKDQGLMEVLVKIPSSATTCEETFLLCEKSVNERTQLIVDLRGIYPNMKSELRDSLMDFLSLENDWARELRQLYSRSLELGGKIETIKRLETIELAYLYKSELRSDINEVKDGGKRGLSAASSFKAKYLALVLKEVNLAKQMDKATLRFIQIFGKYQPANITFADEQLKAYQDLVDYVNPF